MPAFGRDLQDGQRADGVDAKVASCLPGGRVVDQEAGTTLHCQGNRLNLSGTESTRNAGNAFGGGIADDEPRGRSGDE